MSFDVAQAFDFGALGHVLRVQRPLGLQRVGEPGTRGEEVVAPGMIGADSLLYETRRAWKQHVRSGRADDDEVDVVGRQRGALNRFPGRLNGKIRCGHARIDDMPLADTGALEDPFIAGVDHALEVGVGEHARRHIRGQARDSRTARRARRRSYHRVESFFGGVRPKYW